MAAPKVIPTLFNEIQNKVHHLLNSTVESILKGKIYNFKDSDKWVDSINREATAQLKALSTNFKYIISTTIVQKQEAAIESCACYLWDTSSDGNVTSCWENDTIICTTNAYVIAL